MRVLVTGVAGFLGSHLADAFLERGDEVLGIDDFSGGDLTNVPVDCEFLQMRCQSVVPRDFEGVDVVYHCAALAHEGLSVFSPYTITESIFGASVAVFSAAIEAGVKRIVYCSSMARYGMGAPPFSEYDELKPQDPYGIAKVASEKVLWSLMQTHGLEVAIAVPHNIVGPRQKYDDPFRNVVSIMANRMLQGERPYIYGDGRQIRCFSDIRDVISTLVLMHRGSGGVFNVGPDSGWVTINEELAARLAEIIGFQGEPIYVESRPMEVHAAYCSSSRIRDAFGFGQKYSLQETLSSIVEWIKEQGPKPFRYHLPIEISEGCPVTWKEQLL